MKIIYNCFGGSHASVTAAGIHLGFIKCDRLPTNEELINVPYYDGQVKTDHGHLRLMGIDEYGHEVFIVGRRNMNKVMCNLLSGVAKIFKVNDDDYLIIDALPYVNWKMMLGGYISRRLGIIKIGRPIVIKGTKDTFFKLVTLVNNVKINLPKGD
jgi:hypothetical protein